MTMYQTFLETLSKPASRALVAAGIDSFEKLSAQTEKEVLRLHGIGKASFPKMQQALKEVGLTFKPA